MSSFNKIFISGWASRDAELRYTPAGMAIASFSLASNEKKKDQRGEAIEIVTWFKTTFFGKQAENVAQYVQKGTPVIVEGRLRQESYVDREGNTRYSLEVTCTDFHLMGSKSDSPSPSSGCAEDSAAPSHAGPPRTDPQAPLANRSAGSRQNKTQRELDAQEDDIPFILSPRQHLPFRAD